MREVPGSIPGTALVFACLTMAGDEVVGAVGLPNRNSQRRAAFAN